QAPARGSDGRVWSGIVPVASGRRNTKAPSRCGRGPSVLHRWNREGSGRGSPPALSAPSLLLHVDRLVHILVRILHGTWVIDAAAAGVLLGAVRHGIVGPRIGGGQITGATGARLRRHRRRGRLVLLPHAGVDAFLPRAAHRLVFLVLLQADGARDVLAALGGVGRPDLLARAQIIEAPHRGILELRLLIDLELDGFT